MSATQCGWLWMLCMAVLCLCHPVPAQAQRQVEDLGRGLTAMSLANGQVFLTWRLLGPDPPGLEFQIDRSAGSAPPETITRRSGDAATCWIDEKADLKQANTWHLRPIIVKTAGKPPGTSQRSEQVATCSLPAQSPVRPYIPIPVDPPEGYTPNDGSVGDLDGDGEYEIVVHMVGTGRDNSQNGATTSPILDAYRLDGRKLWRIDLGRNIREGAHYTQFIVFDFNGDGRAEVACKTADGTIDGTGRVLGEASADHRNAAGRVLTGPEFLTMFDGRTGRALDTRPYLPTRGKVASWGDDYGNRADRFLAGVAYLDGRHPSLIMCRGYYTRMVMAAWDWNGVELKWRWTFDSHAGPESLRAYDGQGDHSLSVGDVDDDGRDEIVYGACTIDDNGQGLYSTGLGHGDALHLSDLDPDRPGLEVFNVHEHSRQGVGVSFRDARTGKVLWSKPSPDVGRGVAFDIDPRHRGCECWALGDGLQGLWNARGEQISAQRPRSCNFGVWWDGDLLRELLDRTFISKWDWQRETENRLLTADGCAANNGTKATPVLCADVLGDWREEVIWRSADNRELRLYVSTLPTEHRLPTLMHDSQYRLSVASQNVGYNQPPHPSFFLGDGMAPPARASMKR